jgi:hypothetical protein
MKKAMLLFSILMSFNISAQDEINSQEIFVRVYDLKGKKIGKGKILSISDAELQLSRGAKTATFQINNIGSIRTKRSIGHNALLGMGGGIAIGAMFGNIDDSLLGFSGTGGGFIFGTLGGLAGTIVGIITGIFKKSKKYIIGGDAEKIKAFMEGRLNHS